MSTSTKPGLEEWVRAINEELGTAFETEESGRMFLEFEGGLRIGMEFPEGASTYVIYAPIGQLSTAAELPRLLAALQMNLYQRATAGGVIGLDVASGTFVYSFSWPVAHSSPAILARQLDQFAEHARRLQTELAEVADADGEFDFELNTMKESLGLVSEEESDAIETGDDLDDPPSRASGLVRV